MKDETRFICEDKISQELISGRNTGDFWDCLFMLFSNLHTLWRWHYYDINYSQSLQEWVPNLVKHSSGIGTALGLHPSLRLLNERLFPL